MFKSCEQMEECMRHTSAPFQPSPDEVMFTHNALELYELDTRLHTTESQSAVPASWRQSTWACTSPRRQGGAPRAHRWSGGRPGCPGPPATRRLERNPFASRGSAAGTGPTRPRRSCWGWPSGGRRKEEGRAAGSFCRSSGK